MDQLSRKLMETTKGESSEVLLKFLGMAVLGVVESFVLGQFKSDTEQVAKQVGELLEQMIPST